MRLICLLSFILVFSNTLFADSIEIFMAKQRRELHETRRELGLLKEKCYQSYPDFFKPDHPDYDRNLLCLEEIQKKDENLRKRHKKELCMQFNIGCNEK